MPDYDFCFDYVLKQEKKTRFHVFQTVYSTMSMIFQVFCQVMAYRSSRYSDSVVNEWNNIVPTVWVNQKLLNRTRC